MADVVDAATRSRMMAGIRGRNTKPEMVFRRGLHRLGFRYRLQSDRLPGKPDLILPRFNAVVFVHGCFWHGHDCPLFRWPKTRRKFWTAKIRRNRERDIEVRRATLESGWRHLTVWECAFRGGGPEAADRTTKRAALWIRSHSKTGEIRGGKKRGNR